MWRDGKGWRTSNKKLVWKIFSLSEISSVRACQAMRFRKNSNGGGKSMWNLTVQSPKAYLHYHSAYGQQTW